jgi:hypothetical protein
VRPGDALTIVKLIYIYGVEMWIEESSIVWPTAWRTPVPPAYAIGPAISADFDDTLAALVEHGGR